ncbi:hypothetical protein SAY87_026417 [Trapa incisa]|uniref:Uncharacterized protein n=1 Tax=Trapa incisa TaxID=236973 RepID=A0AAN7GXM2_9MYRT|nr:hypothetical protein SAY87_026417 [Trapa incisa]
MEKGEEGTEKKAEYSHLLLLKNGKKLKKGESEEETYVEIERTFETKGTKQEQERST